MKQRRVLIFQPYVPAYRMPLFRQLAARSKLYVRVVAGTAQATAAELRNSEVNPGFDYSTAKMTNFLAGRLSWHHVLAELRWVERGDVVVISGNPRILSNLIVIARVRARGAGVLWWGQGWTAGRRGIRTRVRRYLMKYADTILLYTDLEREQYLHEGFNPERTFSANNALDQSHIKHCSEQLVGDALIQFQRTNGLLEKKLVLFCGRIEKKAELSVLIAALPRIIGQCPEVLVVIIGDGSERAHCETLARTLGVEGRIRWLGAIYEETELAPWFLSSSLFAYPGSIGLGILHAFGYGLSVVTHNDPIFQMPEFAALENGRNGLTFQRGNSFELADIIVTLLEDGNLRREFGGVGRSTVETKYSMENMVNRFVASIEAAANVSSVRRGSRRGSRR